MFRNGLQKVDAERRPLLTQQDFGDQAGNTVLGRNRRPDGSPQPEDNESGAGAGPWIPIASLLALTMAQQICSELIFPFINQMILENGIANAPEEVGFYSGFVESIYQITCFFAVLPCTWLSNKLGRKPVILIGMVCMSASTALFVISKSYLAMLTFRGLAGAFSGTVTVVKVVTSEISKGPVQTATALSLWQVAFRLGQMLGQPLGGLLSHPSKSMALFDTAFFRSYPFSLPGLVSAVIMTVCAAAFALTVPETLEKRERDCLDQTGEAGHKQKWSLASLPRNVIAILMSLFSMAIIGMMIFFLYPLFAFTPIQSGGLGLSETQIGAQMGLRSLINVFFMLAYTYYASSLSAMKTYKACMCMWPFVYAFLPALNAIARARPDEGGRARSVVFNAVLVVYFILWSAASVVWLSTNLVINETSSSPEMLPTVMGIAQMVCTIGYAAVPTCITSLFAYSVDHRVLGGNLVYVVMIGIGVAGAVQCLLLRDPVTRENERD